MERFLNFETRQRFQVNLDTGAITVEPSKVVHIPAEEVKTPKQNISKDTDWRGFEGPPPANSFMHNLLKGVFPELPNVEFRFDIASNEDIPSKTSPLSGHTWLQEIEKAIKESWNQEAAEGGMSGNPFRALHERMAEATKRWINPDPERKAFIEKVEKEAEEAEKRDLLSERKAKFFEKFELDKNIAVDDVLFIEDNYVNNFLGLIAAAEKPGIYVIVSDGLNVEKPENRDEFKKRVLAAAKSNCPGINPCVLNELGKSMAKTADEIESASLSIPQSQSDKLAKAIMSEGTDFKPQTMDFSAALWELKRGKKVRRTNHTAGDYLYIPNPKSNYPENYIHKKTGIDDICQWRPREGDVIADNWIVVD